MEEARKNMIQEDRLLVSKLLNAGEGGGADREDKPSNHTQVSECRQTNMVDSGVYSGVSGVCRPQVKFNGVCFKGTRGREEKGDGEA